MLASLSSLHFEKFVEETATHVLPFIFLKLKLDRVFDLVLVISVIKDQHTIFQNNSFCENQSSDIENQSSKSEKYLVSWLKSATGKGTAPPCGLPVL